jgi:hypothetical protein
MLTTRLLLLVTLLSSAGCQAESKGSTKAVDVGEHSIVDRKTALDGANVQPTASGLEKVDPAPVAASRSAIVSQSDIQVNGKAACDFVIRYPDTVDQNVTWNGEPCKKITARFIAVDELQNAGQLNDLSEEAKTDLGRLPGKQVFYIESEFTASAYPLNVAGVVYEVSLAD